MRKSNSQDKLLVVNILSKAFDTNKSVNYVVKQDRNRQERIRHLMAYSFNVCQAFGEIWISDDDQACALILHPDKKKTSLDAIMWDVKLALKVIGLDRVGKVLKRESEIKKVHPISNFAYLWFIGVNPELQGRGVGSRLMEEVIAECQKIKRPIYLETSVDRNVPWYKKFGFEVFQSLDLSYKLFLLRKLQAIPEESLVEKSIKLST